MPAWITSLLRDEVTVPMPSAASRMIDLAARLCEPPGDRKTDHPGTDHDAIHFIHREFESSLVGGPRWRRISPPGAPSRSIALAHYRVVWDDLSGDPRNFFTAGSDGSGSR